MSRPVCAAARKDGEPCQAPALPRSPWCWAHDPAQAEQAARARAAGASKGGRARALQAKRRKLTTTAALVAFVDTLIWDAVDGKHDPRLVNAITAAVALQRTLLEQADVAERLEDLERAIETGPPRRIGG